MYFITHPLMGQQRKSQARTAILQITITTNSVQGDYNRTLKTNNTRRMATILRNQSHAHFLHRLHCWKLKKKKCYINGSKFSLALYVALLMLTIFFPWYPNYGRQIALVLSRSGHIYQMKNHSKAVIKFNQKLRLYVRTQTHPKQRVLLLPHNGTQ